MVNGPLLVLRSAAGSTRGRRRKPLGRWASHLLPIIRSSTRWLMTLASLRRSRFWLRACGSTATSS